MCCGVHFYRSRRFQVLYQKSINAVLIMSVLRKKTGFYKGESDREVIVIAAGGLGEGAPLAVKFSHYGVLPSHQIFSSAPESHSSPYCYLKWDTKWINSQGGVQKIFSARIFVRICNSKTFNPLPSTEFLGECHQPTEQTLMENPGGSRKEPWLGFRRQNPIFFAF